MKYKHEEWDEEPMNEPDYMPLEEDDKWSDEEHDVQKEEMEILKERTQNQNKDYGYD